MTLKKKLNKKVDAKVMDCLMKLCSHTLTGEKKSTAETLNLIRDVQERQETWKR